MGESRPAKRILAFATAALLSGIAAPRVQAQESEWLEVCAVAVTGTAPLTAGFGIGVHPGRGVSAATTSD